MIEIREGDNLVLLKEIESNSIDLIYIDPPFNTGKVQKRTTLRNTPDENGDRTGFQGKRYSTEIIATKSYNDSFDDYIGFLEPRLREAYRVLKPNGSLFFHNDYREVHYCKILLDEIFGRDSFINEIIWAYDYGAKSRKKWPPKHDNILFYVKDPNNYTFNYDEIDFIPYQSNLAGKEKLKRGKKPTDVWWISIVNTNSKEKTGYPTQKPEKLLSRIVRASSNPGDQLLDFFAGSGTLGSVCKKLGRNCILMDNNPEAIAVMQKRLNIGKAD